MSIDERLRLNIHTKLTEILGNEEADALIAHIMPVPWHDVATKDDLLLVRADIDMSRAQLRNEVATGLAEVRTEIAEVRTEITTGLAEVRTEIAEVRTEIATGTSQFRSELGAGLAATHVAFADLRIELSESVHHAFVGQTRWMLGYVTALSAVVMGIARLLF